MSELSKHLGQRIRNYRTANRMSQEHLAELSGVHPTYIGQLERGEKNATIDSISKVSSALKIPLSKLFENLDLINDESDNIPLECYEFISSKNKSEQESLMKIILEIDKYKSSNK